MGAPITTRLIPTPHSGCETSSLLGSSRQATLTSEASLMSAPAISSVTRNAISSPASEGGPSLCASPDGPTIDLFGQEVVPASRSVPPERARRPMTAATCGLRGFLSSPSGALQSSLESKLKRRLDGVGSTLFTLTWKAKATPAGRPYFQLVASARRTSDSGFGSWPTPMAGTPAQNGHNEAGNTDSGRKTVELASWPTATAHDAGRGGQAKRAQGETRHGSNLQDFALLASWPTPRAEDSESSGMRHGRGVADTMTAVSSLASWATPTAVENIGDLAKKDARRHRMKEKWKGVSGNGFGQSISEQAQMAHWITPQTHDVRTRGNTMADHHHAPHDLSNQALLASGTTPNGLPAQTESPGQLDPDHSRWVMGYPVEHLSCAPTETPSFLKSQRNSSAPFSKHIG